MKKAIIKNNHYKMKEGVWLDFPKYEPKNGEAVLIHKKYSGNYWEAAVYNKLYKCWDDEEGRDHMYELDKVDKFMLIPDVI